MITSITSLDVARSFFLVRHISHVLAAVIHAENLTYQILVFSFHSVKGKVHCSCDASSC